MPSVERGGTREGRTLPTLIPSRDLVTVCAAAYCQLSPFVASASSRGPPERSCAPLHASAGGPRRRAQRRRGVSLWLAGGSSCAKPPALASGPVT
jgi:hypothetical protein